MSGNKNRWLALAALSLVLTGVTGLEGAGWLAQRRSQAAAKALKKADKKKNPVNYYQNKVTRLKDQHDEHQQAIYAKIRELDKWHIPLGNLDRFNTVVRKVSKQPMSEQRTEHLNELRELRITAQNDAKIRDKLQRNKQKLLESKNQLPKK